MAGHCSADIASFWNLTDNIYRFTPAKLTENLNQHTVNEVRSNPEMLISAYIRSVSA